jgi:hypothetical protein
MDYQDKLDICYKSFAEEFGITEKQAKRIINNFDLEDSVMDYYQEEIKQAQEIIDYEYEQNKKHYNDGWQDHIGG